MPHMLEAAHWAALVVHVVAGVAALGCGFTAMATRKGSRLHRRAGRWFFRSMLATGGTALVLSALHPNLYLAAIALFSLYLVAVGWRAATVPTGWPERRDRWLAWAMLVVAAAMIVLGVARLVTSDDFRGIVLLVFGAIGASLALADMRDFRAVPLARPQRIARHLRGMIAALIAAMTATLVVNLSGYLPAPVLWLGPTVALSPLIAWWTAKTLRQAPPSRSRT
jgi:uncharacterized membrane protein